jgi:3-deoxy-D-manno-octulosonic-acid transferase
VYFLYSLLMGLAALLTSPYWLIQGLRHGKYLSNLKERLGLSIPELGKLPANRPGAIWIHAVSVGEALSGVTLARRLKDTYPQRPLIVSTTTLTGYALAKERMPFADAVIFFPLALSANSRPGFSTARSPRNLLMMKPRTRAASSASILRECS